MVQVKVRSLVDTHLATGVKEYQISRGQVFTCELKNQQVLDELVRIGVLSLVDPDTPDQKPILVIYPEPELVEATLLSDSGEPLPLSGGLNVELEQDIEDGCPFNSE